MCTNYMLYVPMTIFYSTQWIVVQFLHCQRLHSTLADMNSSSLEKNMSWRLATGLFYCKFSLQNVYCDYQVQDKIVKQQDQVI